MEIKVNGKIGNFEQENLTIADVMKANKVQSPDMVSVRYNGKYAKKEEYSSTNLKNGDSLDFLYFMGGGTL